MATFFGEILPVFSRAVDDEDDELDSEFNETREKECEVVLHWGPEIREELLSGDNKINCQSLIFAIGEIACEFSYRYYVKLNDKPVGVVSCGLDVTDKNTLSQREMHDNSCFIYKVTKSHSSALVVIWHHKATPVQTFDIVTKVFHHISKNVEVLILTSLHVSEYKTLFKEVPFVQALISDSQQKSPIIQRLDVPNFVTGLPATVLQYCQVRGIPATLYVSYNEADRADSINVDVFRPLLSIPPLSNYLEDNQSIADRQNIVDNRRHIHYVYM